MAFHTTEGSPPGMRRRTLFSERYVLAGRTGFFEAQAQAVPGAVLPAGTCDGVARWRRLQRCDRRDPGGGRPEPEGGAVGAALSVRGLRAIAGSDLVAMVPARLVRDNPALRVVEAPVEVPGYEMSMLWDERSHRDPAHRWLREQIAGAV
ncbi:MAG: LysR substrate-binding domain-containing protein [Pseudomonas sp.]